MANLAQQEPRQEPQGPQQPPAPVEQRASLPSVGELPLAAIRSELRPGMGYRYHRGGPVNDDQLQLERAKVTALQDAIVKVDPSILKEIGWDESKNFSDGFFGPKTKLALEKLQKKMGVPAKGVYDEATATKMISLLASAQQQTGGNPPEQQTQQQGNQPQGNQPPQAGQGQGQGRRDPRQELQAMVNAAKGTQLEPLTNQLYDSLLKKDTETALETMGKIAESVDPQTKKTLTSAFKQGGVAAFVQALTETLTAAK